MSYVVPHRMWALPFQPAGFGLPFTKDEGHGVHADGPWGEAVSRETASSFDSRKRISMQMNMTVPGDPYPMRLRQPVPGDADPSGRSSTVFRARICGP